jgi:regulator of RNase E activity RraA
LGSTTRIVAPVSTVLFVDNEHQSGDEYPDILVPKHSNLPQDKHFSDVAAPGSVVIMQQPYHQIAALLGDIVATRYKVRGVLGVLTDGRTRDIVGCEALCKQGEFTAWAKGIISCGTSTEGLFYLSPVRHGSKVELTSSFS